MPVEILVGGGVPQLDLPARLIAGYLWFAICALFLLFLLLKFREHFISLTRKQWLGTGALAAAGFLLSGFLPLALPLPTGAGTPAALESELTLLAAVPLLLAGATLNPGAALAVGFASGVGRTVWLSHQLYDPFFLAFVAVLAALAMRQNYAGRIYRALREPAVAGALGPVLLLPLLIPSFYVYNAPEVGHFLSLEWALISAAAAAIELLLEGLVSGFVVTVLLIGVPQWRASTGEVQTAPIQRSLEARFMINYALLAAALGLGLVLVVVSTSITTVRTALLDQMALTTQTVSQRVPMFRDHLEGLLVRSTTSDALLRNELLPMNEALGQLFRAGERYQQLLVVEPDGTILAVYPPVPAGIKVELTGAEQTALEVATREVAPVMTGAQLDADGGVSVMAPVTSSDGRSNRVLIGRVSETAVQELLLASPAALPDGSTVVLDESGAVVARSGNAARLRDWRLPSARLRSYSHRANVGGEAFSARDPETGAAELFYVLPGDEHAWNTVFTVPYELMLGDAFQSAFPLLMVITLAVGAFGLNTLYMSRSVSHPLRQLVRSSQQVAEGSLDAPITVTGPDEIGQLGQAVESMRSSLKNQLEDLGLLLGTSETVSSSLNIGQGMPAVLEAAIRGTGAAGARAVVLNPTGRYPLTFGAGPLAPQMGGFDRRLAALARSTADLVSLVGAVELRTALEPDRDTALPFRSVVALALTAQARFQGVLWLAYSEERSLASKERDLLRALAGQASVLVENTRLFALAEGGRRRLAAVLASTADAVIVTDQTDRILLINPAMERAFGWRASNVVGRPVTDIITDVQFRAALVDESQRPRIGEVKAPDGNTYYVSAATVSSKDGQMMGQVAVLRDISNLKELDRLKTDFVQMVSHDLRNPLTFLKGNVELLRLAGELNEDQSTYLKHISEGVQQMTMLVTDLLDLGRLEAGLDLVRNIIMPRDLLLQIKREQAESARAHGLELRVEAGSDLPPVIADKAMVERAISNLVSNAINYAPHSGFVTLRAVRKEDEMIFSVEDRGPGITREDQVRLFEKFHRIAPADGRVVPGSGLGLALVKSIAERHSGRVWCQSQPGQGSVFYFTLPANRR